MTFGCYFISHCALLNTVALKFCIQNICECAEYKKGQILTTVASGPDIILKCVIPQSELPHTTDTHPIQIKSFPLLRARRVR